jgi:hypothetical protein
MISQKDSHIVTIQKMLAFLLSFPWPPWLPMAPMAMAPMAGVLVSSSHCLAWPRAVASGALRTLQVPGGAETPASWQWEDSTEMGLDYGVNMS